MTPPEISIERPGPGPEPGTRCARLATAACVVAVAAYMRIDLWPLIGGDYNAGFRPWFNHLGENGFAGFKVEFSNYNTPYLYLLWMATALRGLVPDLIVIKGLHVLFDFVAAALAWRLVREVRPGDGPADAPPLIAFCAVLLAPSVVFNASMAGQIDAIYAVFVMLTVLAVMRAASLAAWVAFGVAVAIKLQGIFVGPFLVVAALRRHVAWWPMPIAVALLVLAPVPASLTGRPYLELARIYVDQSQTYPRLASDAPNFWTFFDNRAYAAAFPIGLVFATLAALALVGMARGARRRFDAETLLLLATVSCAVVPFVLPKMHDRYFMSSDVLSIALAAANPTYVVGAIGLQLGSALAYMPWNMSVSPARTPSALINLVTIPWFVARLVVVLHPELAPRLAKLVAPGALARALLALAFAYAAWNLGLGVIAAAGRDVAAVFGRNMSQDLLGGVAFLAAWAAAGVALRPLANAARRAR